MEDNLQGLYPTALDAFEAGKRTGHEQVLRHVRQRLSVISVKHETEGTADSFRAVEECCADMRKLQEQYEAVHGRPFNLQS